MRMHYRKLEAIVVLKKDDWKVTEEDRHGVREEHKTGNILKDFAQEAIQPLVAIVNMDESLAALGNRTVELDVAEEAKTAR